MYTYYPVPSEVNVKKGEETEENDKLSYLLSWTGALMEVLVLDQCLGKKYRKSSPRTLSLAASASAGNSQQIKF